MVPRGREGRAGWEIQAGDSVGRAGRWQKEPLEISDLNTGRSTEKEHQKGAAQRGAAQHPLVSRLLVAHPGAGARPWVMQSEDTITSERHPSP